MLPNLLFEIKPFKICAIEWKQMGTDVIQRQFWGINNVRWMISVIYIEINSIAHQSMKISKWIISLIFLILDVVAYLKGECIVFKNKNWIWMKTMHYTNTIRSHLVTIIQMASFTPKSTSKLRSALHIRYSIVIPCFISRANTAQF